MRDEIANDGVTSRFAATSEPDDAQLARVMEATGCTVEEAHRALRDDDGGQPGRRQLRQPPRGRLPKGQWGTVIAAAAIVATATNLTLNTVERFTQRFGGFLSSLSHSNYILFSLAQSNGESYLGLLGLWIPMLPLTTILKGMVAWLRSRIGLLPSSLLQNGVISPLHCVCLAIYLMWQILPSGFMHKHFVQSWSNLRAGRLWTLLTANLSHYSASHLIGNMAALATVGETLQDTMGPTSTGELAIWAALASSACSLTLSDQGGSLGASGICMGFHAAAAVLLERTSTYRLMNMYGVDMGPLGTLGAHLAADFLDARSGRRPVDWAGHLGGAAAGYFYVTTLGLRVGGQTWPSYAPRARAAWPGDAWVIN